MVYNASWLSFIFRRDEKGEFEPLISQMERRMTFKRTEGGNVVEEVSVGCPEHAPNIDLTCSRCWLVLRDRWRRRPFIINTDIKKENFVLSIPLGLLEVLLERNYDLRGARPHIQKMKEILYSKLPKWKETIEPETESTLMLSPEQLKVVKDMQKHPRLIVRGVPGAGKTFTAIGLLLTAPKDMKICWLTHMQTLKEQSGTRIQSFFNEPIGYIGEGIVNTRERITVAMFQTLYSRLREGHPAVTKFVRDVDLLIVDEMHHVAAETFLEVTQYFTKAYLRYGLSATPFREIRKENYFLVGALGHRISTIKSRPTPIKLVLYDMLGSVVVPPSDGTAQGFNTQYMIAIVRNKFRNEIAALEAIKNIPSVIIVQRVEHGEILLEVVRKLSAESGREVNAVFLHGEVPMEERELALRGFEEGHYNVLIISDVGREGLSLKNLNAVILAAGQKSRVALIQRVGRGLHPKGKGIYMRVVDFIDAGGTPRQHSFIRLKTLKENLVIHSVEVIPWEKGLKRLKGILD